MKKSSEFGKGFVYNLILFASHFDREKDHVLLKKDAYMLWFNGASDHLYELEIPEQFENTELGRLAKKLQHKALELGHGFTKSATKKDFKECVRLTKDIGLLIDKELGIKPIKGDWE